MNADESFRPVGDRGKPRDRNRRRIRSQHRGWLQRRAKLGKNLAFDLLVLSGGFDDEVAVGKGVVAGRRLDPAQSRVARRWIDLVPLNLAREVARDSGEPGVDASFRDIVESDIDAG